MEVVLATNEPWGVYHATPLVGAAADAGVRLRQWCPSADRIPRRPDVDVVTSITAIDSADLVVVNGLFDHPRAAAVRAVRRGVPVAFCELAYLNPVPPVARVPWAAVTCVSQATRPVIAACAGCDPEQVRVVGWPGLDSLPARQPEPGLLTVLTSVSSGTFPGQRADCPNRFLREAAERCEAAGYRLFVRPHPREAPGHWDRWEIDRSSGPDGAITRAEVVLGAPGTATMVCAALGVPFVAPVNDAMSRVPAHLVDLAELLHVPDEAPRVAARATAQSRAVVERVCGPIGGAAARAVRSWTDAISARRAAGSAP